MASVHDVAAYILKHGGAMNTWKLQKLVYYCQAWHLVWDEEPLFEERIEAWSNGPVAPDLYKVHRGQYRVTEWTQGDIQNLTTSEKESINIVLRDYGSETGFALRALTHSEDPWRDARGDYEPGERCSEEITTEAMAEYYGSL
jgi:uncharacterized phage-associated protein